MDDIEKNVQGAPMSLAKAAGIYAALLVAFMALVAAAATTTWISGGFVLLVYLVCGFVLNRVVLRNLVEWHPMHDTIANVASAKLRSFAFWPLAYASLFFSLAVNNVL